MEEFHAETIERLLQLPGAQELKRYRVIAVQLEQEIPRGGRFSFSDGSFVTFQAPARHVVIKFFPTHAECKNDLEFLTKYHKNAHVLELLGANCERGIIVTKWVPHLGKDAPAHISLFAHSLFAHSLFAHSLFAHFTFQCSSHHRFAQLGKG